MIQIIQGRVCDLVQRVGEWVVYWRVITCFLVNQKDYKV